MGPLLFSPEFDDSEIEYRALLFLLLQFANVECLLSTLMVIVNRSGLSTGDVCFS
jgi:hypothetical protein